MSADAEILPLKDAILRWCNEGLIQAHQRALKQVDAGNLRLQTQLKKQLRARQAALVADFRRRIEEGLIHLSGVMIEPDRRASAEAVEGRWIGDFEFDWEASALRSQSHRYVAVRASLRPFVSPAATGSCGTRGLTNVQPEDVAGLTDETILALLEEHHRRVIASPDAQLFPPGKISLIPLLRGKMEARAEAGELLLTLAAETTWLADWIAGKLTLHHTPTQKTIEINLRSSYWRLAPGSKAKIQSAKD